MPREWIGARRIAFIPAWNNQVDQRPPDNWAEQIAERIYFYPDPQTGVDGSISAFVRQVSSGRAWIEPEIFPTVEAQDADGGHDEVVDVPRVGPGELVSVGVLGVGLGGDARRFGDDAGEQRHVFQRRTYYIYGS